jgi:hypothetical protein
LDRVTFVPGVINTAINALGALLHLVDGVCLPVGRIIKPILHVFLCVATVSSVAGGRGGSPQESGSLCPVHTAVSENDTLGPGSQRS